MKKAIVLALVAVFAFAAAAQASSVSFSWGANFLNYADSKIQLSTGTVSSLEWYADDFGYGVRSEQNTVAGAAASSAQNVTELIVDKWLSKSVAVGLGIGSATTVVGAGNLFTIGATFTAPVLDVRGTVQLLSGKGEKVNASLDFNVAARWIRVPATVGIAAAADTATLNGGVATLAVTLGL